jgi:hypothetical protein
MSYFESSNSLNFIIKTDTFTTTGNGTTYDFSKDPKSKFSIQVSTTGSVLAWGITLQGSLDGTNFTDILNHTHIIGNNKIVFSGNSFTPCLYFRTVCTTLNLGTGTNIIATILAIS